MSDIRRILERLNRAWKNRKFEELHQYFDNIAMLGPGLNELGRGREWAGPKKSQRRASQAMICSSSSVAVCDGLLSFGLMLF
ncbi:MAG: hypothetical protein J2P21_11050 [Chloracidobacterium sp.]|nr:hypothetical protein [Chloracidobacterium sp.]